MGAENKKRPTSGLKVGLGISTDCQKGSMSHGHLTGKTCQQHESKPHQAADKNKD